MKDLMGLMKQAKEMQSKMQSMQEEMATLEVTGSSGAGMVTVTLSGQGHMQGVTIDPSMITEGEGEMIEDLVLAAHNDAKAKLDQAMAEKTQAMTEGMQLPPGMKLPF